MRGAGGERVRGVCVSGGSNGRDARSRLVRPETRLAVGGAIQRRNVPGFVVTVKSKASVSPLFTLALAGALIFRSS